MYMKKIDKLIWTMILLIFIPVFIFLIYSLVVSFVSDNSNHLIYSIIALMIYVAITLIIMLPKICIAEKERRQTIISTKPKKRFRYLDSIWYYVYTGPETASDTYVYHIIQEIDTDTIYAIYSNYTNKVWYNIPFQKEGSFWIEEEVQNPFYHNGERVKIDEKNIKVIKLGNEHKRIWANRDNVVLHHENENCDIVQLLNQAIFITGIAEFDDN